MIRRLAILAMLLTLGISQPAEAIECTLIQSYKCSGAACTTIDISAGGFTSDAFNAEQFHTLKIVGNLVDASNGVTNLEHKLTENFDATGTFENYPMCIDNAPTLECGQLKVNWNPNAQGKDYTVWIPWRGRWAKLTVTPTGHGASDTLTTAVYGCY